MSPLSIFPSSWSARMRRVVLAKPIERCVDRPSAPQTFAPRNEEI